MKAVYVVSIKSELKVFKNAEDAYSVLNEEIGKPINGRFVRAIFTDSEGANREHEMRLFFIPGVICELIDEDGRVANYFAPGEKNDEGE